MIGRWVFKRFHKTVRIGYDLVQAGGKNRVLAGSALIAYGILKKRKGPELIYKASIDADEAFAIRVMKGRRPIAETAPIVLGR
jgi:hypothetical protein